MWGSGKATRDFLYVEEAARAIVLALEKIDTPDPINIGSGKETPIVELVNTIMEKVGFRGEVWFDAGKPDGQPRRWLDISLARKLLSFEPKVNLSEGLDRTITWYRSTVAVCGERKCA